MKHNTKLSVKKAEKKYGKMPSFIPEVSEAFEYEELEENQIKTRLRKLESKGEKNE